MALPIAVHASVLCLFAPGLLGQALLQDIRPQPADPTPASTPQGLAALGGTACFFARDEVHGLELWRTDGTTAGTTLVLDAVPGTAGFYSVSPLAVVQGAFCFLGAEPAGGALWRSDGTAAGTTIVRRFTRLLTGYAGTSHVGTSTFWFVADDGTSGFELWRSDGTAVGTVRVADINPGPANAFPPVLLQNSVALLEVGGVLFFTADDGSHGVELWRTDGTAGGTVRITDLIAGPAGSLPRAFHEFQGQLLFAATVDTFNWTWWLTDGTPAGAHQVSPVPVLGQGPLDSLVSGGLIYFQGLGATGNEPYVSDGTAAGTHLLLDIYPGPGFSAPDNFIEYQGAVYFSARDTISTASLWRSDGTAAGTRRIGTGPDLGGRVDAALVVWNNLLWYEGTDSAGAELWRSDGTPAGTVLVADIAPGVFSSFPKGFLPLGTRLLFAAEDPLHGSELWSTDGSTAGTQRIRDIAQTAVSSAPTALFGHRGRVFFTADDGVHGREPWVSDGTVAGTRLLADLRPGSTASFVTSFGAWHQDVWIASDMGLYRSDGATVTLVRAGGATDVVAEGTRLYFGAAPSGLYASDGTPAGTVLVRAFSGGVYAIAPVSLVTRNGRVYFLASEGLGLPAGVWRTDGTAAGTTLVLPLPLGVAGRPPFLLRADLAAVYVLGSSGSTSLYRIDDQGSALLFNAAAATAPELALANGRAFFTAYDAASGVELWSTDGTPAGTGVLADIQPGPASSVPAQLVVAGGRLFFTADDGVHGRELWTSDGTATGTRLVLDATPGIATSGPTGLRAVGVDARVVYAAADPAGGNEPWTSDGTAAGTVRVADLAAGPVSTNPSGFANAGATLLFAAQDNARGTEPWSLPIALTGAAVAEAFGRGCPGTGGRAPEIGATGVPRPGTSSFAVTLRGARPLSASLTLVSLPTPPVALAGGCELLAATALVFLSGATDANGAQTQVLPVPADATLRGGQLVLQAAIVDPAGALAGVLALSDGLRVVLGR